MLEKTLATGKHIHCVGVCGTGMGAVAGLLQRQGYRVTGSDTGIYPPMSDKLKHWGIAVQQGFAVEHLQPRPDLVVIGNVVRADNPEAIAAQQLNIPIISMPQAIAQYLIKDKHCIVVTGTHGKTTTTALIAHMLLELGYDPSYLIGGAVIGQSDTFRIGQGNYVVVEGDEYDTAYFDKGPKFLHYKAKTLIVTSLEYDHADIFADLAAVKKAFAQLLRLLPKDGQLLVCAQATEALDLVRQSPISGRIYQYSDTEQEGVAIALRDVQFDRDGLRGTMVIQGKTQDPIFAPLWGQHACANLAAVIGVAVALDISLAKVGQVFTTFQGIHRRLEVRGVAPERSSYAGVTVVDDFAHHPTAVAATIQAAKLRWPKQRILVAFEPRSASNRRNTFQALYPAAFAEADGVIIASHARLEEIPASQRFSPAALVEALQQMGKTACFAASPQQVVSALLGIAQPHDILLILSNGDFGGLIEQLMEKLAIHPSTKIVQEVD